VKQRSVRLARAGADVRRRLEQRAAQVEVRELASDRGTYDPCADDDDVAVQLLVRDSSASMAAADSQRASRSSASAADMRGS